MASRRRRDPFHVDFRPGGVATCSHFSAAGAASNGMFFLSETRSELLRCAAVAGALRADTSE
jgi:hypothetical protein